MRWLTKDDSLRGKLIWWLLFLRIPFWYLGLLLGWIPPLRGRGLFAAIEQVGASLLIAALIYLERERLKGYHIDPIFLWMFVLGKPIEFVMLLAGLGTRSSVKPIYGGYILASLVTLWVITTASTPADSHRKSVLPWIIAGIALGLVGGAVSGVVSAQQEMIFGRGWQQPATSLGSVLSAVVYQSARAGMSEEPLFRGFLWGHLKEAGWNENRIWVYQAALFTVAHLPYLFLGLWGSLVLSFLGGLGLGWLVRRSRAISTTVVAHGLTNGVAQFVAGLMMN